MPFFDSDIALRKPVKHVRVLRRVINTELTVLSIPAKWWLFDVQMIHSWSRRINWISTERETLPPIPDATDIQKCRSVNQRHEKDVEEKTELPWKDKAVFCHYSIDSLSKYLTVARLVITLSIGGNWMKFLVAKKPRRIFFTRSRLLSFAYCCCVVSQKAFLIRLQGCCPDVKGSSSPPSSVYIWTCSYSL